ncbi:hypothetical protein [uncultured Microbulbifer sp.]|uniref:hypothetical protein n=1 Tax=uncultured Microbulbifer sp. TaxID=348147 RepID=UPI00262C6847|nr:hypothetical protein [uncultured Microbulbifer sp.]
MAEPNINQIIYDVSEYLDVLQAAYRNESLIGRPTHPFILPMPQSSHNLSLTPRHPGARSQPHASPAVFMCRF